MNILKDFSTGLKISKNTIQMSPSEMKEACYKTIEINNEYQ